MPAITISNEEFRSGEAQVDKLLTSPTAGPATTEGQITILSYLGLKLVAKYNIEHNESSKEETIITVALQAELGFLDHAIATLHLTGEENKDEMTADGTATILEKFDCAVNVTYIHNNKQLVLKPSVKVGTKTKTGRIELKI